jgi:hypothetical protein
MCKYQSVTSYAMLPQEQCKWNSLGNAKGKAKCIRMQALAKLVVDCAPNL